MHTLYADSLIVKMQSQIVLSHTYDISPYIAIYVDVHMVHTQFFFLNHLRVADIISPYTESVYFLRARTASHATIKYLSNQKFNTNEYYYLISYHIKNLPVVAIMFSIALFFFFHSDLGSNSRSLFAFRCFFL